MSLSSIIARRPYIVKVDDRFPESASSRGLNLDELMNKLKLLSAVQKAQVAQLEHEERPEMEPFQPTEWTAREIQQDIAAVEICPAHPKYMVIGTYTLVKKDDQKDYPSQVRKGEILVIPVAARFIPAYTGQLPPIFDHHPFSCAVLDLHFHPSDPTLLGVATSGGQMHFYRFVQHADVVGRQVRVRLLPLGSAKIAEDDEFGLVPLITHFQWLPGMVISGKKDKDDQQYVSLTATTSLNEVLLVHCILPAIQTPYDKRLEADKMPIAVIRANFPSHTLEAWTVATSIVKLDGDVTTVFILSGGDDSTLIASLFELGPVGMYRPLPSQVSFIAR